LGHKVHPTGFRLGVIKDWQSKWYTDTSYDEFVLEDVKLRNIIRSKYSEAAISLIEIDRQAKDVTISLHTARPGIVIGRGGQRVDEMRHYLEGLIGKKIRLNILEVRQPELDAYLVARSVAEQIERRIAYRRAMKQAIFRTIQAGAKGIKVSCAGRLGNAEIARRQTSHEGQVPLHTLRADIDYGFTEAHTTLGRIGVKVWIYKGQILPEPKAPEIEEEPQPEAAAEEADQKPAEQVAETTEPAAEEAEKKPAEPVVETTEPAAEEAEEKSAEPVAEAPEPVVEEAEEKPAEAVTKATEPIEETAKKPAKAKKTTAATTKKPKAATAKATAKKKEDTAKETADVAEKEEKPAAKKTRKTAKAKKDEAEAEVNEAAEPTKDTEEEAKDAAA
jgi:small subunit ribosomal protein S3